MPLQTSIPTEMLPGAVGRRQNMEEWNTITCIANNVEANPIGFGVPVMRYNAGGPEAVRLYDGSGVFRGLTEADVTLGAQTYPEGYSVPVMESGVIWVLAGATVEPGEPVAYDSSTGRYEPADTSSAIVIPNAEFDSAGGDGDLVTIRLRRVPGAA